MAVNRMSFEGQPVEFLAKVMVTDPAVSPIGSLVERAQPSVAPQLELSGPAVAAPTRGMA